MNKHIHAIVSGKVQGVGFRYVANDFASKFGLFGHVKNLPDGTVQLVVQGDPKSIETLFKSLKERFRLNEEHFKIKEIPEDPLLAGFEIQR